MSGPAGIRRDSPPCKWSVIALVVQLSILIMEVSDDT